jgi:hypothetical protein
MVTYPIHVSRKRYGGRNLARLRNSQEHNRLAEQLENYLNAKIEQNSNQTQVYLYAQIAIDLGFSVDAIRAVLFAVDSGHNGLTVRKPPVNG